MAAEIDLGDSAPLYEQVRRAIEAEIASGGLATGDRLPSEPRLCERFGVSQITVRRAMRELAQQGLIIRRSGLGSFVASSPAPAPGGPGGAVGLLYRPHRGSELPADLAALAGELSWAASNAGMVLVPAHEGSESRALRRAGAVCGSGVVIAPGLALPHGLSPGVRAVAIDPPRRGLSAAEIILDRRAAGREAAAFLIRLGHRSLGFVGRGGTLDELPPADVRAAEQIQGFREALELSGLSFSAELCGDAFDPDAMARVIAGPASGLVCLDDAAAARAAAVTRGRGLRVPEDMSVVGHGGTLTDAVLTLGLTTVAYDWKEIAAAAVGLLGSGSGTETFSGSVETGRSTSRPGAGA